MPTQEAVRALEPDPSARGLVDVIQRISTVVESRPVLIGSRSLGIENMSSDVDILFKGEQTYSKFCRNILSILSLRNSSTKGPGIPSRSRQQDIVAPLSRFPWPSLPRIWNDRITKFTFRGQNISFHFSHHYNHRAEQEGATDEGRTTRMTGTVVDSGYSCFMPRRYEILTDGSRQTVLSKMFLYSGVAKEGEHVIVQGTQVSEDSDRCRSARPFYCAVR